MGDDDSTNDDESGFARARAEKEAIYPDEGYVFAEIDMLKPPGEALTPLGTYLKLTDVSIPPAIELTDHVVYDADGSAYTHESLQRTVEDPGPERVATLCDQAQPETKRTARHALYGLATLATTQPDLCRQAVPTLTAKLDAPEKDVRAMALEALAALAEAHPQGVTPATDAVIAFLDPTVDARLYPDAVGFVAAVIEHDPAPVIDAAPRLAVVLQEDTEAGSQALVALKRIAEEYPDAVVPAAADLQAYVEDSDAGQRVGALAVLGTITKEYPDIAESMIPTAVDLLEADPDRLRANAAALFADLADEYPDQVRPAVPTVVGLLADADGKARYNATSILARVAKEHPEDVEQAIDPLIDALDEEFPPARANACWALGHLEADRALERLEALAESDPDESVRDAAGYAADEIDDNS